MASVMTLPNQSYLFPMNVRTKKARTRIKSFERITRIGQARFMRFMLTEFRKQRDEVLENLDRLYNRKQEGIDIDAILFDLEAAILLWQREGQPIYFDIARNTGNDVVRSLGVQVDFNLTSPGLLEFLADRLERFSNVNRSTVRHIRRTLQQGVALGESIDSLSKRIRRVFRVAGTSRARTIAVTETISAANRASLAGASISGVVQVKEWLTSNDSDVRTAPYSHVAAAGERVALHDVFRRTGEEMQAPATGTIPANNINCRCTQVYSVNNELI